MLRSYNFHCHKHTERWHSASSWPTFIKRLNEAIPLTYFRILSLKCYTEYIDVFTLCNLINYRISFRWKILYSKCNMNFVQFKFDLCKNWFKGKWCVSYFLWILSGKFSVPSQCRIYARSSSQLKFFDCIATHQTKSIDVFKTNTETGTINHFEWIW